MYYTLFVVLLLIGTAVQARSIHDEDTEDYNKLMDILSKPRVLSRNKPLSFLRPNTIRAMSWENCGSSSDPIQMTAFTLTPDPIIIPGDFVIGTNVTSSAEIGAPIRVEVTIQKRVLVWVTLPCGDLCIIDDLCEILDAIEDCPQCQCPLPITEVHVPDTSVTVPDTGLPSWLESGDYRVTIELNSDGQDVGCMRIQFSLSSAA